MWSEGHALKLGKYTVIKQIGGGGFGLTYLVKDCTLRRQVVIKAPNRQYEADQDYEKFIRRFQREGQALAKISHPHVVQVIELFQEAGMPCLVMAYVAGETLNERIRTQGRLSQDEAVSVFRKIAGALERCHQAGFVHCDIHPGNIILKWNGEPVLIDFGSAKLLQPGTWTVTTTVNESFAPYEQVNRDKKPQPTLDVYSLSATLYFAVTGNKPQTSMERKLFGDQLQPPQQHCRELNDWLNQAIAKGMALEKQDRPISMQAWMGLMSPPDAPAPQPIALLKPFPTFINRAPRSKNKTKSIFPWAALTVLFLGYFPTGVVLGLVPFEAGAGALALALALAGAWSGAGTVALAWAWSGAGTVAVALAWAWSGAGVWAWSGAGSESGAGVWGTLFGAWALAGTWSGVWAWSGTWSGVWTLAGVLALAGAGAFAGAGLWAFAVAGIWSGTWSGVWAWAWSLAWSWSLLGGGIAGYFTGIGIVAGIGVGLLAFIQFFCIIEGSSNSVDALEQHSRPAIVLIMLGLISTLGLICGWGLGWVLQFSGVS